ncbi:MAG: hypothetical protein E2P02_16305 [Acidobacteria bacterium]|nr:MAG: hypothetical protein E2P02_16305 [Acidobacteriota bacterium]
MYEVRELVVGSRLETRNNAAASGRPRGGARDVALGADPFETAREIGRALPQAKGLRGPLACFRARGA